MRRRVHGAAREASRVGPEGCLRRQLLGGQGAIFVFALNVFLLSNLVFNFVVVVIVVVVIVVVVVFIGGGNGCSCIVVTRAACIDTVRVR